MMSLSKNFILLSGLAILGSACSLMPAEKMTEKRLGLKPTSFSELPEWSQDNHHEALATFAVSCARILKGNPDKDFGLGTSYGDWQSVCATIPTIPSQQERTYFEEYFTPYIITDNGKDIGLLTGYYEASLRGNLTKTNLYQTPLLARPDDLVMVNLGDFSPDLKGKKISGRVKDGTLKPYESRADIETGKLLQSKPICWVDSAVDAFFLHIQGSGIVTLPDGKTMRVGYDGQNGHPYTAIGKVLIEQGELQKGNVTMQSIRGWLSDNPAKATKMMQENKSYIFFKRLDTTGPVGGEGVILTPERSLAVDHIIWPYGVPMFLNATHPDKAQTINRLMVAQDTGGAIKGAVRGDYFWGYGDTAAHHAGLMQSQGKLWVLLPNKVTK